MKLFTKNTFRNLALSALSAAALSACGGAGSCASCNGGVGSYNLVVDNTSPVPLINNSSQQFYVYLKNMGTGNASDLNWNIADPASSSSSSALSKLWNKVKSSVGLKSNNQLQVSGQEIKILDSSNCTNVQSGASCRLLLQANDPSSVVLQSTSTTSSSAITENVVSAYGYTPSYSEPAGTLTLSPLSPVNYGNGFAGYTFFIINNSTSSISLEQAPFGTLPAGIDYSLLAGQTCPNPLPGHSACQVRMTLTAPSNGSGNTIAVNLTPSGTDANGNLLPTQGTNLLTVSDEKLGNVSTSTPLMSVDANSSVTSTAYAYISNTGSAPLSLGNLSSGNPLMVVSNDNCSGSTLNPGAVCRYQLNIDPTQISGSGTAVVTIPYNDGKTSGSTSTSVSWTYASLITPNPALSLSSTGNLSQVNLTSVITILNSGNVVLRDLGIPALTTTSNHLTLSNNNCSTKLEPAQSCTYTLSYAPVAPSEATTASLGDITAKYIDQNGVIQSITLSSSTAVNVNSIFAGYLSTGGDFSLSGTNSSHNVTITNNGNYTATISNLAISGSNLQKTDGDCIRSLAPQDHCSMTVSLQDSATAGSGNGNLTITYNNHSGDINTTASSNINWLIGEVPSLNVIFDSANLVTIVGSESSTDVILTNNGNSPLSNITLPALPSGFSWQAGSYPACATNNTQNLAIGISCHLSLIYLPTVSTTGTQVTLGKFSATTAQSTAYTSASDYVVTVTAVRQNALSFDNGTTSSISQTPDWTNQTVSATTVVKNINGLPITITSTPVTGVGATATGCSGVLASNATCTLTIGGTYNSSGSGSLTINYTDSEGTMSQTLPIVVSYQAQPIITPNLAISKTPSGVATILNDGTVLPIMLTLTNTTTVQNAINAATDGNLKVVASSLIPSSAGGVTYAAGSGGTCVVTGGDITISNQSPNNSCTYIMNVSSTAAHGTSTSATATSQYQVQAYTNPSTVAYGSNQSGAQIGVNVTVQSASGLLTAPALVNPGQSNVFVGVEQGISVGPISFTVQNVGYSAVSGAITAPTIAGFSFNMAACNNLASGAMCTFTATLNSLTAISLANLNTSYLTYNGGSQAGLPNMQYSVIAADTPAISQQVSVSNCQQGNGISSICLINTDKAAPVVTITLTNIGNAVASNFSVNTSALSAALGTGYSGISTTGCSGNLGVSGQCVVTISPTTVNTSADSNTAYDITTSSIAYSYHYGSSGQLATNDSTPNFMVNTTVASPVVTVGVISNLPQTGSESSVVTLSNWYESTLPANPIFTITPSGSNITVSSCVWSAAAPSGASCSVVLTTSGTTTVGTYAITATAVGETSAARSFVVNAPLYLNLFITATGVDTSVNQTGSATAAGAITNADSICNSDANKPSASVSIGSMTYKALLWSNSLRKLGTDWPIKASTKYQTVQNGASPRLLGTSDANGVLYSLAYQINPTNGGYGFLAGIVVDTNNQTWTGGLNCSNWTDTTRVAQTNGAYYGFTGNWYQPPYWVQSSRDYCVSNKTTWYLLCVEQP